MGDTSVVIPRQTPPTAIALGLIAAALACGALTALPFWIGRLVPLLDLPQHLALITVLVGHAPGGGALDAYFVPEWGEFTPYWLHYGLVSALAPLLGVELASRVYLTLYALCLPWGGVAVCRAFGRPAELGLLAAPLALGANLYFGFVNFCSAVVVFLFLLALQERHVVAPSARGTAALAGLSVVLFFAHIQVFAFACLCTATLTLLLPPRPLSPAARVRALLPVALVAALLCIPWAYQTLFAGQRHPFGRPGANELQFQSLPDRLADLSASVAGNYQDGSDTLLVATWGVALALLWLGARRRGREETGLEDTHQRRRLLVLVGLTAAAYLAAPLSLIGQWNIAPRFAFMGLVLVPALVPVREMRGRCLVIGAAVLLSGATGLNAAWHHARFDAEAGAFDRVIDAIPPGQRVLPLMFDNTGLVLARWPYLHLAQYYTVRRGGVVGGTFAAAGPLPVRLRDPGSLPHPNPFYPDELRCDTMAPAYDFVLSHGGPRLGGPRCPLVPALEEGPWRLYRVVTITTSGQASTAAPPR